MSQAGRAVTVMCPASTVQIIDENPGGRTAPRTF